MTNKDKWIESKYVLRKGKLIGSRDSNELGVASRLIADLVAGFYDKNLREYAKGQLLDLGCGNVPLYSAYKPYVEDNICVDWENALEENIFLDHFCDLNTELPLADKAYDTIILSDVLEHLKEPKILWHEMSRIMKSDGVLLLNVPFYYWIHADPYDYHRYTQYALRAMAEESGFEVVELKSLGGVPEILADILAKTLFVVPVIGKISAIIIQYITSIFIKTGLGSRISRKTADRFPLGYTMVAKKGYS